MLYYVFLFPVAIGATLLTIILGFTSIPTAFLSLLLIGVVLVGDFKNPELGAYVLCCMAIIGFRASRAVIRSSKRGH